MSPARSPTDWMKGSTVFASCTKSSSARADFGRTYRIERAVSRLDSIISISSRAGASVASMDPRGGDEVVQVGDVHLHDHRRHPVLADVHGIAARHRREVGHALLLRHPLPDGLAHVVDPLADERTLLVEVALVTDRAVTGDERVLAKTAERIEGPEPQVRIGLLEPRVDLAEDVVAGEDDALFLHDHRRLVRRVAGHVDQPESMVAHVELHLALEGDD